jgi:diguanylate cyclase (GGDEF)-like protein/PAS domain S-box-containing protein
MPGSETESRQPPPSLAAEALEPRPHGSARDNFVLRLYVGGMTQHSLHAIQNIRNICAEHLAGRHQLEIIDIYQQPMLAKERQIVAAPTLIKEFPLPSRRLIGDLSLTERLLFWLDIKAEQPASAAKSPPSEQLAEIENLRHRLAVAEETLRAIGKGEVDVLVVGGTKGEQVFTLDGAEHPYRILVESMNEGAVTLATDGTILYCNNRLATLLQTPLETLIGMQFNSRVSAADRPLFEAQRGKSATEGTEVEINLMTGAGNLVPVLISRGAHDLRSGAISMVITDLTQQKQNEEIIASEVLARSIIEQAGEAIVVCDEAGKIVRANRVALQICGKNPLLNSFDTQFRLQTTETKEFFSVDSTLNGQFSESIEVELKQSDQQVLNLILTATPLKNALDHIIGCVVTLTDFTERKRSGEALRQERDRAQSYLDTAETIMVVLDAEGRTATINRKGCQVLGCREDELIGELWRSTAAHQPGKMEHADAEFPWIGAEQPEAAECYESPLVTRLGELRQIAWHDALLRDDQGKVIGLLKCGEDITDRKLADEKLQLMARVFEHSGEAVVITGPDNRILAVNSTFTRLTGYSQEEVVGQTPKILQSGKESKDFYVAMWETLARENYWQGELWDKRKDGTFYPKWLVISVVRNKQGEIINYIGSFTDISERKQAAHRIEHLAHHDPLTNLSNRYSLLGKLSQALELAKRSMTQLSLLFIDLDHFKNINDSLGHHIGDILLNHVAERLLESVRSADIVARIGGDEFVVVLQQIHSGIAAAQIAGKIQQNLSQAIQLEGHSLHITPSIGISMYPGDGETVDELMKNADLAMYHAKSKGRNNYQFYKMEMNRNVQERLLLESDLLAAIEREEFVLHYQPQIDMSTGRMIGVEALVRWQQPQRGLVLPDIFIPVAEDTGLILPIGELVLKYACRQMAAWTFEGLPPFRMAVNLSARQFKQPHLPRMLEELIAATGVDPHQLELEITESVAMDNPETAIFHLRRFREMGVELAIDDFGTGYSSLSYLKLLPVNRLKIDRSFIMSLETDSDDTEIAAATIALAHTLGKEVVAEGVETEGQLSFLRCQKCDIVQGFLFSHPLPASEILNYLRQNPGKLAPAGALPGRPLQERENQT